MRIVVAFVLLASVLTTHAVALERASTKVLDGAMHVVATVGDGVVGPTFAAMADPGAPSASESTNGPCIKKGDCAFLLPTHRFSAQSPPLEHGQLPAHRPAIHYGKGLERPPIS